MINSMKRPQDQSEIAWNNFKKDIPNTIRAELASLEKKDNWHNTLSITGDWLVITLSIAALVITKINPFIYILACIVIGSRQRALMNLLHEASHNKLFKNRIANDWISRFSLAYPLGASLSAYRAEHYIHHGFLWDEAKDPKTIRYKSLGLVPPPRDAKTFFTRQIVRPLLLMHVAHNIAGALSLKREQRSETVIRFGFLALLLIGIVATHLVLALLLFWIVPFCTSFQIIRYWNEMAEHAGLQDDNPWLSTRNWTSNFLVCWILAPHSDDLYHLTHHLFPLIPYYHLAKAHRFLMQVPQYANAHHCNGFFFQRRPDAPSVIQDIRRPEDIVTFRLH